MRSIIGLSLLITGLSIGAYAYYPETVQNHVSLANVTRVIAPVASAARPSRNHQASSQTEQQAPNRIQKPEARTFSPGENLLSAYGTIAQVHKNTAPAPTRADKSKNKTQTRTAALKQPAAPATHPPQSGWTAVVTPATPRSAGSRPLRSANPADGSARYALVRDMQRELKRVGCYWGKIDGDWGPGTKRAIQGFVSTVNAALPTSKPDYILLALVRAQNNQVCGISKSNTVIASKGITRQRTPIPAKRIAAIAPQPKLVAPKPKPVTNQRKRTPPGKMAVGGPRPDKLDATQTAPGVSSQPATHTAARPLPVKRKSARVHTAPQRAKPTPRAKPALRKVKKRKAKRRIRVANTKAKKRKRKYRRYRRKRSSPLGNLLRQGVY